MGGRGSSSGSGKTSDPSAAIARELADYFQGGDKTITWAQHDYIVSLMAEARKDLADIDLSRERDAQIEANAKEIGLHNMSPSFDAYKPAIEADMARYIAKHPSPLRGLRRSQVPEAQQEKWWDLREADDDARWRIRDKHAARWRREVLIPNRRRNAIQAQALLSLNLDVWGLSRAQASRAIDILKSAPAF